MGGMLYHLSKDLPLKTRARMPQQRSRVLEVSQSPWVRCVEGERSNSLFSAILPEMKYGKSRNLGQE